MLIYCDTHVHCYDFDLLPELLDCALVNFQRLGAGEEKVLFFTDGIVDRTWRRLRPLVQEGYQVNDWQLRYSKKTQFIHANKGAFEILLAPARQINSVARIEYLLLGCDLDIEDGLEDRVLLSQYTPNYTVISPWGVGKWLGSRGKLLSQLIAEHGNDFLLGDNGGRPSLWSIIPQFNLSKLNIVNGSDPLPIEGELDRVASYGIKVESNSTELTLSLLLDEIKLGRHQNYGHSMSLFRFLKGRFAMAAR